jgi:Flp pilus assembly protein CpaB
MRTYDIRSFLLPGVLALAAAALTLFYIGHSHAKSAQSTPIAGAAVYVATSDIAAGTSGDQVAHSLRLVHVPTAQVVDGAVTSPAQLAGRVATGATYKGQQVTLRSFAGAAAQGTAGQLTGDFRAISLAGDPTQVLAGTAKTGDHVDVVASVKTPDGRMTYGRTVARDLLVLAAANAPSGSVVGGTQAFSVTLRATDAQAQTVFYVSKNGDWSLELRPALKARNSSLQVSSIDSVVRFGR